MRFRSLARVVVLLFFVSMQFFEPVSYAAPSKRASQQSATPAKGTLGGGIEMLTDTEGVDFNSYLRDVYLSIKKRWFANMPASVQIGQQGTNTVEFRILQDGTVPKDSIKLTVRSEKSDLDAASVAGIREAAPLGHLPEKFTKPFIVLRFTFYYNVPIPRNPH
jgi:TonB family protein